jgi:hypothetical protein
MSFDLYLQRFRADAKATFSRRHFEIIFARHVATRETAYQCVTLGYPDGGGGVVYIGNCEEIDGFTVNRPGGKGLFDDLFLLMKRVGAVVYWGCEGGLCLAVVEPGMVVDLPPDMRAAVVSAITVASGAEIMDAISRS